ncbi:lytic murein transglycosylase B [Idiomarina sp. HP20-50]|uniref:lytic murein transglycosylase B n=1 Tax=Idiomarina sp. HP20-50 TaxID=3070813 RepID=UPI00294AA1B8|nr:lytic murein transglycosylase B [Idiomarina sp. HP20-50]MDV6315488.1 lytic murein transglycosylase B [Idiomarina sp. HP20-50]
MRILFGLALLTATTSLPINAQEQSPEVEQFIQEQVKQHQLDEEKVRQWMQAAEKNTEVLEAIQRPWEAKPWYQYHPIFLTEKRLKAGLSFWNKHQETLTRAEKKYGVPAQIIVAIIGIESFYGSYMGKYSVLDSLYTLGFHYPPRATFFRSELSEFFQLASEEDWDVAKAKGSYAGAMGFGQFISSSYRHYAVDFDNDGQRDILTNPVDAIGSVANYFAMHNWAQGQPVAQLLPEGQDWEALVSNGMKPNMTRAEIRRRGYELPQSKNVNGDTKVRVFEFETKNSHDYWLGYHNFYVITRYNHSPLYAMVVYQFSEQLRNEKD